MGHAVGPLHPCPGLPLHVKAWQNHFSAIFASNHWAVCVAFSPSEMALPNHPDVAYEFVKTLKDCELPVVLVQEQLREQPLEMGGEPEHKHIRTVLSAATPRRVRQHHCHYQTQGSDTSSLVRSAFTMKRADFSVGFGRENRFRRGSLRSPTAKTAV